MPPVFESKFTKYLYFMRDLKVHQILSPTTFVSFLDPYTLHLAKP